MCIPNFIEFKNIPKTNPITGYRCWRNLIKEDNLFLLSEYQNYKWNKLEGPHEITKENSGIYAYNYNYNNNYNYYNNNYNYCNYNYYYYNNYYNYNNNNNYNYYNNNYYYYILSGIIYQYGKIAIHKDGQRSEFAKITHLFTIKESDAQNTKEFLDWIKKFNNKIKLIAKEYECETIHWQDFLEINK